MSVSTTLLPGPATGKFDEASGCATCDCPKAGTNNEKKQMNSDTTLKGLDNLKCVTNPLPDLPADNIFRNSELSQQYARVLNQRILNSSELMRVNGASNGVRE